MNAYEYLIDWLDDRGMVLWVDDIKCKNADIAKKAIQATDDQCFLLAMYENIPYGAAFVIDAPSEFEPEETVIDYSPSLNECMETYYQSRGM